MCAVPISDISEFGVGLSVGSKKKMEVHGCCGWHALSRGELDPKYEFGEGKPEYVEHSLLGAVLSKSYGSSVSVQTSWLEGLPISMFPVCCSVCLSLCHADVGVNCE